jgi:hypothetical protein
LTGLTDDAGWESITHWEILMSSAQVNGTHSKSVLAATGRRTTLEGLRATFDATFSAAAAGTDPGGAGSAGRGGAASPAAPSDLRAVR